MRNLPCLLICPFLFGCLAFGYPSVTRTPPVAVPESDVKAFRFTQDLTFGGAIIAGAIKLGNSVEEIPIERSEVIAQSDAYFRYFVLAFPFAQHRDRSVGVRLYRRGFETVEVEPQCCVLELGRRYPLKIEWKRAATLEAREDAIKKVDANPVASLEGGVAEFLAAEYAALADEPSVTEADRQRLLQKSDETRKKAQR